MLTPEGTSPSSSAPTFPDPVATADPLEASPSLKSSESSMKQTPQPNMTQSRLTSMLQPQSRSTVDGGSVAQDARRTLTLDEVEMDTSSTNTCPPQQVNGPFLTTECFFAALKENTAEIIGSFNASIGALSKRIDKNSSAIATNTAAISSQAAENAAQKADLSAIAEGVSRLERVKVAAPACLLPESRATLSRAYILARRSVRLWPVIGDSEEDIWAAVGDFLHERMGISQNDVCQDDIETISRIPDSMPQGVADEVLKEEERPGYVELSRPGGMYGPRWKTQCWNPH